MPLTRSVAHTNQLLILGINLHMNVKASLQCFHVQLRWRLNLFVEDFLLTLV